MKKRSAGVLVYRVKSGNVEVLLGHPGGPYWAKKDEHAWSIPKGEIEGGEDLQETAKREFEEELGQPPPEGKWADLGESETVKGKVSHIWAVEGDLDVSSVKSNMLKIEWPPKSGQKIEIPEIDKAEWIAISKAKHKLHKGQAIFVDRLIGLLQQRYPAVSIVIDQDDAIPEQATLL